MITQKLVQTGITIDPDSGELGIADDIVTHRRLMGIDLQPVDLNFSTCPYRFQKPASPHLALKLENKTIDPTVITTATKRLQEQYDVVLLEGAGGLLVPITEDLLTLDYIAEQGYPVMLVTSGRLGSINHTLLSLEAITSRGLTVHSVIYNSIHNTDDEIVISTKAFLKNYLNEHYPAAHWLELQNQNLSFNSALSTKGLDVCLPNDFI